MSDGSSTATAAPPASARPAAPRGLSAAIPAELALAALTVVTAATFWRLFVGTDYLVPLVSAAVVAHALCWWMRRVGLSLVLAMPLWAIGGALYITSVWYRDTTRFLLPTQGTWDAARADLSAMADSFATAVAPVPSTTGYLVAAVLGLWLVAFAADTLAFRALGGVEAVLPTGVGFVMASALGDGRRMLLACGLWIGTAMLAVAMLRAWRSRATGTWLTSRQDTATGAALRWTAGIGALALLAGVLVGPRLPGSTSEALIDTRNNGEDANRVTVSPLVDIKSRLSSRSSTVAFRVRSDRPSYLRLSALDEFDGQRWTPSFDYGPIPDTLDAALIAGVTTNVTQTITIDKLGRVFVPAAFSPVSITANRGIQWDPELQTIVVSRGELKAGDSFTIQSAVPDKTKLTATLLESSISVVPQAIVDRYTALPERTSRRVDALAQQIVADAGASTPFEQAIALQNWFRANFVYDLNVPSGSGTSAIDSFLNVKRGYCEQFAGTMAAMARSLNIPARVAVGFTQGIRQADGTYRVEGKHAHAWPEVYLGGIGWVPFEPTPGRGNPDAEQYTGVPTQQVDEGPVQEAPATTTTIAGTGPTSTLQPIQSPFPEELPELSIAPGAGGGGSSAPTWLLGPLVGAVAALVLVGLWIVAVRALYARRWRRRFDAAGTASEKVVVRWHQTLTDLRQAGYRYRPQDTPTEVARRLTSAERLAGTGLDTMARHVTTAAYARSEPDPAVLDEVERIHRAVSDRVHQAGSRRQRLLRRLDPRPLWGRLPGDAARADDGRLR